jgi:Cu-processing system permease protein
MKAVGSLAPSFRVFFALILHELRERTRDRWVLVFSALFAILACGVGLYGRAIAADAGTLTGPSLVTLAALMVPLVALILGHDAIVGERERNTLGLLLSLPISRWQVVLAKFIGRYLALVIAVSLGLCSAALAIGLDHAAILLALIGPCLALGGAFLALGVACSTSVARQATAASLVVSVWFLFVFFYDLGLLGLMVASDGQISASTIAALVYGNPAGLFRLTMMVQYGGAQAIAQLGLTNTLPPQWLQGLIWMMWFAGPLGASALLLTRRRVER